MSEMVSVAFIKYFVNSFIESISHKVATIVCKMRVPINFFRHAHRTFMFLCGLISKVAVKCCVHSDLHIWDLNTTTARVKNPLFAQC